jgi:hypothetical protein
VPRATAWLSRHPGASSTPCNRSGSSRRSAPWSPRTGRQKSGPCHRKTGDQSSTAAAPGGGRRGSRSGPPHRNCRREHRQQARYPCRSVDASQVPGVHPNSLTCGAAAGSNRGVGLSTLSDHARSNSQPSTSIAGQSREGQTPGRGRSRDASGRMIGCIGGARHSALVPSVDIPDLPRSGSYGVPFASGSGLERLSEPFVTRRRHGPIFDHIRKGPSAAHSPNELMQALRPNASPRAPCLARLS